MKIAVLGSRGIPNRYGGFEEMAARVAPLWVRAGHEVVVYATSNHPEKVEFHEFDDVENKITAAITSSTDYNQNYNIFMPVKNVNYRNYKVGTNVEFKNNCFGSIYHESAYGNSKKIYQDLVAKLKYSF